jgi:hypothetical protein
MPAFPDLDALNDWLEERCKLLWAETAHGRLPGTIADGVIVKSGVLGSSCGGPIWG